MDDEDLQNTLIQIERSGWDSLCDSTGDTFYGQIMTDDAVMGLANGAVMDRDAVSLGQAAPWRKFEISEARRVHTGTDCATLVYVGTAYRDEEEPAFLGAMSSVYLREGDDWRLALYQQTPIPDVAEG